MNSNFGFINHNAWLGSNQDFFQEEISYASLTTFCSTSIHRYWFQFNCSSFVNILIDGFVLFLKVCYVQKYMTESGSMLYDMGCTYEQVTRSFKKYMYVFRYNRGILKQDLLTLPEHLSSPPVFSGVRVTRSLVLYVCFVDRCLSFCPFSFGHCVVCSSSIYRF